MYYVFFGEDIPKLRTVALAEAHRLAGDSEYHVITEEGEEGMLSEAASVVSLFSQREVYVLDTLSGNEALFERLMSELPHLSASANVFVIIEGKLGVKDQKTFTKYAEHITHFPKPETREFNVFALTDALSMRDKKSLWVLLQTAWRAGKSSEEIIGTLHWQLKTIRLAALTKSAGEAGVKPFVYDKAKRALSKYTREEIEQYAHALVVLYHEGHSGKRDINNALESWTLSL